MPEPRSNAFSRFLPKYVFALLKCIGVFSFGVFRPEGRMLIWRICQHYGYLPDTPKPQLPEVSPDVFLDGQTSVRLAQTACADGNVSPIELAVLGAAAAACRAENAFEIGTFDGRTTLNLALNAAPTAQIYTLDLPPEKVDQTALALAKGDRTFIEKAESGARFKGQPEAARITQLYGDSATFDFSKFAGGIDMVFVDGAHSFEYVLSDAATALKLLKRTGGLIFFHDYASWDGVTLALDKLARESAPYRNLRHISGTTLAFVRIPNPHNQQSQ
jgi:predicted O-methyltransferase YrrM